MQGVVNNTPSNNKYFLYVVLIYGLVSITPFINGLHNTVVRHSNNTRRRYRLYDCRHLTTLQIEVYHVCEMWSVSVMLAIVLNSITNE